MILKFLAYIVLGVILSAVSIKVMLKFTKSKYGLQDYAYDDYKLYMKFQAVGTLILFFVDLVVGLLQIVIQGIPKGIVAVCENPKGFLLNILQVVFWPFSIPYYLYKVYDNEMIELLSESIKRTQREVGTVDLKTYLFGKRVKKSRMIIAVKVLMMNRHHYRYKFLPSGDEEIDVLWRDEREMNLASGGP